jgi:ABC-2 type transport system ATP-binding protein
VHGTGLRKRRKNLGGLASYCEPMLPLTVADARKRFGEVEALRGVSLELRERELLALLGPNGAGKTTLVRAIGGRVRLDGGAIELLGQRLDTAGERRELGIVPQEVALYGQLTARENLQVFGRLHGLDRITLDAAVADGLAWTGLTARADEPIKRFSGGMRRRLNIACGVLHRPRVVLLDEPTVGVDPQSRERIYEMLGRLKDEGATMLLTTHQLEEAEARCDRVVIIDHGEVVASGTVGDLVARVFGATHELALTLDAPLSEPIDGFEASGTIVRGSVSALNVQLPALLDRLQGMGRQVVDLQVSRPGLPGVFLHLTGRELRE